MHMPKKQYQVAQSGQVVMVAVMIFLVLSVVVVVGISSPIASQVRNSSLVLQTRKSVNAADILQDDALYRLNSGRTLPATIVLSLNDSTSTAQITDVGGEKQIIAVGESGRTERASRATYSLGTGVSISYGLQVGNGGLDMSGGPIIYGNVYSNGNITGSGGATITGSANVASYLSSTPILENTASGTPFANIEVGKSNNVQLIAQKFRLSSASQITAIGVHVKKNGAPANATLKIYNSSGGNVGSTQQGGSGSMSASLVSTSYDWVEIYPTSPISLSASTDYWLTIEYQGSNANYYTFAANDSVYADGALKLKNKNGNQWGNYYDATPDTQDLYFTMMTGATGSMDGVIVNGNANAAIVNNSTIGGSLYCQQGTGNNKACDTTQPLPVSQPMPVSAANIQAWKDNAAGGTIRNSSWSIGGNDFASTSGAMKIVGDLTLNGNGILELNGPLWVTGTLSVSAGGVIRLSNAYGTGDEVVVVNKASVTGGGVVTGNGQAGSYILLVADDTTSSAISASGGAGSVVLVAPYGTINFSGNTSAKSAIAYRMVMSGNNTLVYETGLADISFTTGPSGAWNVDNWREISQ
jgi:hypothetical protein